MITVEGFTAKQRILADLIWNIETVEEVEQFINRLPETDAVDARIARDMIIAAALDQFEGVDLAKELLDRF